jgi:hypothetical protein
MNYIVLSIIVIEFLQIVISIMTELLKYLNANIQTLTALSCAIDVTNTSKRSDIENIMKWHMCMDQIWINLSFLIHYMKIDSSSVDGKESTENFDIKKIYLDIRDFTLMLLTNHGTILDDMANSQSINMLLRDELSKLLRDASFITQSLGREIWRDRDTVFKKKQVIELPSETLNILQSKIDFSRYQVTNIVQSGISTSPASEELLCELKKLDNLLSDDEDVDCPK